MEDESFVQMIRILLHNFVFSTPLIPFSNYYLEQDRFIDIFMLYVLIKPFKDVITKFDRVGSLRNRNLFSHFFKLEAHVVVNIY